MDPISSILIQSKDSSEALKKLYQHRGADNKFSMTKFCKAIGMPSTGNLSDIIQGKRRLHPKYTQAVCRLFQMNPVQCKYFQIMVKIDREKKDAKIKAYTEKLSLLQKDLKLKRTHIKKHTGDLSLTFEIFCTFGLHKNKMTLRQIQSQFSSHSPVSIKQALKVLEDHAAVAREGHYYHLTENQILFGDAEDEFSHLKFLTDSIAQAKDKAEHWFSKPDKSVLRSEIISVSKQRYREKLPKIRELIAEIRDMLEEDQDADDIVRLNIQLYPLNQ